MPGDFVFLGNVQSPEFQDARLAAEVRAPNVEKTFTGSGLTSIHLCGIIIRPEHYAARADGQDRSARAV